MSAQTPWDRRRQLRLEECSKPPLPAVALEISDDEPPATQLYEASPASEVVAMESVMGPHAASPEDILAAVTATGVWTRPAPEAARTVPEVSTPAPNCACRCRGSFLLLGNCARLHRSGRPAHLRPAEASVYGLQQDPEARDRWAHSVLDGASLPAARPGHTSPAAVGRLQKPQVRLRPHHDNGEMPSLGEGRTAPLV